MATIYKKHYDCQTLKNNNFTGNCQNLKQLSKTNPKKKNEK